MSNTPNICLLAEASQSRESGPRDGLHCCHSPPMPVSGVSELHHMRWSCSLVCHPHAQTWIHNWAVCGVGSDFIAVWADFIPPTLSTCIWCDRTNAEIQFSCVYANTLTNFTVNFTTNSCGWQSANVRGLGLVTRLVIPTALGIIWQ